jgi:hypothetical protein
MSGNSSLRITAIALGLGIGSIAAQALAQGVSPGYQMQPSGTQAPGTRPPGMRDVFAATLAAVVQSTGVAAAGAVSAGLNGAISGWLDRKNARSSKNTMSYYGGQPGYAPYPGEQPGAPAPLSQGYPGVPGDTGNGYPATGYPGTETSNGYPGTQTSSNGYPNTGYPGTGDSSNGYPSTGTQSPAYPGATPSDNGYPGNGATNSGYPGVPSGGYSGVPDAGSLYAGFAYEIHAMSVNGYAQPVDPATHAFRTGDRFKVVYRPSMPGQVDVYNVNAAGQTSRIDTLSVAAGQLAELGPYEFADMKGNETLILSLAPCSTAALMTATRNIVKVPDASNTNGSFQLSQCGGPTTRGLRTKTRDIRKVSVENGTSFALDALAPGEIASGDVAPRQITISLRHQ